MVKPVIEGYRLSPQQKYLWQLHQTDDSYRSQCVISIRGRLDRSVLTEILQKIVQRHEVLRTAFDFLPGMEIPVQVIARTLDVVLREIDLSDYSDQRQATEIREMLGEDRQVEFDFQQAPMFRAALVKL